MAKNHRGQVSGRAAGGRSGDDSAGVRRRPFRDDDPVDSFFEIPAAVLCATCGQADCPGCTAASDTESGVVAIVPWERSGAVWTRLWATARATTQGAEALHGPLRRLKVGLR